MEIKEAIKRLRKLKDPVSFTDCVALEMAIEALETQEKIKENLEYYLDVNEEKGVVYIPKFVIEDIVNNEL